MLIRGVPDDPDVQRAVTSARPSNCPRSTCCPQAHGGTVSAALMDAAVGYARDQRAECVWLGVNQENQRAQRFYTKHGFTVSGTKSFHLGAGVEHDYVMVRTLTAPSSVHPDRHNRQRCDLCAHSTPHNRGVADPAR